LEIPESTESRGSFLVVSHIPFKYFVTIYPQLFHKSWWPQTNQCKSITPWQS